MYHNVAPASLYDYTVVIVKKLIRMEGYCEGMRERKASVNGTNKSFQSEKVKNLSRVVSYFCFFLNLRLSSMRLR